MHIARNVALLGPNRMTARDHNPRLTAMIVKSYVVQHRVRPEQFSDLITSVNQALDQSPNDN